MNKNKYKSKIIDFLNKNAKQIFKRRTLARRLQIPNKHYQDFKRMLDTLVKQGSIQRYKGHCYGMQKSDNLVTGLLEVKTEGFGFLKRDDGGRDIFISQRNMGSALHKDRVQVTLWAVPKHKGKLCEGKVLKVLERYHEYIVGTFTEGGDVHYVIPDDLKISHDILITEQEKFGAKPGHKVVVELKPREDGREPLQGRIVTVIGYPEDKGVDVLSIVYDMGIRHSFPDQVKKDAEGLSGEIREAEYKKRLDLREKLIFTIDPEDAQDFDDAVSLERKEDGKVLLGVHIADVSYWVPAMSNMDQEALERGNSVYLVDRVIPMFPEKISNNICSLQQGEDRLCYSVFMEMDSQGEVIDYDFQESVINSKYRFSYKEVQEILDRVLSNNENNRTRKTDYSETLQNTLIDMYHLSVKLKARWREKGLIDFSTLEPEVLLDSEGNPYDIKIHQMLASNEIIESFMLRANRTVAEHIQHIRETGKGKYPFVYRIHEKPTREKVAELSRFVRILGYDFNAGKRMQSKKLQRLLQQVKGTRHEYLVENIALRSMMKAKYSKANPGHFGLGFPHYTHFTSPIRRYADLTVHRLLKHYCANQVGAPEFSRSLTEICKITSEREITAESAERESIRAKQVQFMAHKIGQEFSGIISGIVPFGLFVEIPEYLVEGLIALRDLYDDYYIHDEEHYCLIGEKRGRRFRIGDPVRVRVKRVLLQMRKIDFDIVYEE
ncbi:MAG: ribonuclease R [bacterium]